MPSIELTDEEHAALAAALRRLINEDRFPHAPRLDPLRSALAKLEAPPRRQLEAQSWRGARPRPHEEILLPAHDPRQHALKRRPRRHRNMRSLWP
jgi:hypothetical protein